MRSTSSSETRTKRMLNRLLMESHLTKLRVDAFSIVLGHKLYARIETIHVRIFTKKARLVVATIVDCAEFEISHRKVSI